TPRSDLALGQPHGDLAASESGAPTAGRCGQHEHARARIDGYPSGNGGPVNGKLTRDSQATASGLTGLAPIQDVACHSCSVPLPVPLQVGQMTVTHRTYELIRITTSDGLEGIGYAFSRGLPVARIVEHALAPLLIDADPALPEVIRARLGNAYWPYAERGLFSVAASAVDLALWDLLGKRLQAPLADLLGRTRDDVPICGVGGYARE